MSKEALTKVREDGYEPGRCQSPPLTKSHLEHTQIEANFSLL